MLNSVPATAFTRTASSGDGANEPVPLEGVRHELQQILDSAAFADSPRLCALLTFLVDETVCGRGEEIKESVIAVEVFNRPTAFDHRTDSVVRVQIHNLRNKLRAYYEVEGREHPVRIELPQGRYVPVFQSWQRAAAQTAAIRWKLTAAALIMLACGLGWWLRVWRPAHPWLGTSPSIAVLPFLNLSGGGDSDYVADGFVEDLTTQLARMPGLRVAARTSAYQYRGKNEDVRTIGRQLGVASVLEGSVRNEGAKLRVTAQLVSTESGYHLWSNIYERDLAGVQNVESEIQHAVAEALKVQRAHPPAPRHTAPPAARDAYWRGQYVRANWQRVPESVPYFDQAVALDPQFAEAWAALAATHATLAFHSQGSVPEEAAKAKEASRRALQLDGGNPEANTAMALVSCSYDRDWLRSEQSFRRALESNPSYSWAHKIYAFTLTLHGRFDDALAQIRLAQELDPASILSSNDLAVVLYNARRYTEAISAARRHLELDPQYFPAHSVIGLSLAAQGKLAEAIPELQAAANQGTQYPELAGSLGNVLARAGRVAEARSLAARIQTDYHDEGAVAVSLSLVFTGLGEKKEAIEWLRKAASRYATGVNVIGVEPIFDPLRGEPEFQALCMRLGLPGGR